MRLKRLLLPVLCLVGVGLIAFTAVHAQFGLDKAAPPELKTNKDLLGTIGRFIKTALSYLGVLFLILMLYAGFLYLTAAGDDKKIITAKKIITGAVTGLIIIAASYALTSFVLGAVTGTGSPPSGSSSGSGKATGALCSSNSDCASGTCQPPTCDMNGNSCTNNGDCQAPGEVCTQRCQ